MESPIVTRATFSITFTALRKRMSFDSLDLTRHERDEWAKLEARSTGRSVETVSKAFIGSVGLAVTKQ